MSKYIQSALMKGEEVIYQGKVSAWPLVPAFIFGLILIITVIGALVGVILWLAAFISYKSTEVAFTNKRVIAKFGFIRRQTIELKLNRVESVQVNQGIFGRIFNYGSLAVSGSGNPQAPIPGIADPFKFRTEITQYLDDIE